MPASHPRADSRTVRLRSPGETVSAVPFLLGFAPEESLVVIGLRRRAVALTCRLDLADSEREPVAASVVEALGNVCADRVLLVAFASDRAAAVASTASMAPRLERAGMAVTDRLSVVAGRWFDEECIEPRCCPPEGVPVVEHDSSPSAMTLRALTGGSRASRAALVAECHPDQPVLQAAIRSEVHVRLDTATGSDQDSLAEALIAVLGWGRSGPVTPAQLAGAALATALPLVRDVCYAVLAPEVLAGTRPVLRQLHGAVVRAGAAAGDLRADGSVRDCDVRDRLLQHVLAWVRNLPDDCPEVTMPALVVAAAAHWCAGDGARARVLLERAHALDADPLPMLDTLTTCLVHGVRPEALFGSSDSGHAGPRSARGAGSRRRGPRGGRGGLSIA